MGKIFVLDTSAIISLVQDVTTFRGSSSPGFAGVLDDNEIVIPRVVLDEIHELSKESGDRGKTASEAARQLEKYANRGQLLDGVETEKGGKLRIAPRPQSQKVVAWGLKATVEDHEIIATAIEIEDRIKGSHGSANAEGVELEDDDDERNVILISQDRVLRVLARSVYGVQAEELRSVCAPENLVIESGYTQRVLSAEEIDSVIERGVYTPQKPPFTNQFFHLVDKENPNVHYCYAMARDAASGEAELIDRSSVDYLKVAGEVSGKNTRQKLLLWALMGCGESDPMVAGGVRLITVSGPAGSGKSFLTLAAAWERLERGHFERIVITRPMVDVGPSMGYLPGTLEEKLRPWGGPVEDNLRAIVHVPSPDEGRGSRRSGVHRSQRPFDAKAWLEMEDRLELVPLTYIRGRTFRRCFVILEEAQNLERGPLKVLLTRLGEGSICVVIGDRSQIDNQFLSKRNNGLVHAINAFRDWPQAVHISLEEIVRSDLAQAADELL